MAGAHRRYPLFFLALIILALPALLRNNYYLMVLNVAALNVLVVIGLNLLMGFAGQISLGQATFFGLGAYLSAILTATYALPIWPALFLAAALTGLVAYLIGLPSLKLEGHYLVMATLGFNIIFSILVVQLEKTTGGPSGFAGIPRLHLGPLALDSDRRVFYLFWGIAWLALVLSGNLIDSRAGRAMAALHQNEMAARCAGVDTETYKVKIFVLGAVLASLAGSLYAHYITFISPGTFSFFYSIQVVTMVLVGGIGSVGGAAGGAVLLTLLPEVLQVIKDYNVLTYGLVLMIVLIFFPQGLFPWISAIGRRRRGRALFPEGESLAGREGS
ncbi:MAG: branched-chain amino acid ABC transporter permease [Deltaproteobacteria bacterium]|nr:branched-chain amino acid ABC transporter permease [Deltaproteobacteria bacterium]